jgi:hypothetical protein
MVQTKKAPAAFPSGPETLLPEMARVRVRCEAPRIEDVGRAVEEECRRAGVVERAQPGQVIGIGCGSRGISRIVPAVAVIVHALQVRGARPFLFPAMGSHGAATAEGQRRVLEEYGLTEAAVGCPIKSTLETTTLGALEDGTPIHCDRHAAEADGIVLVNRIKPHTNFRGPVESGIVKMMCIGMGNVQGAAALHRHGFGAFDRLLPRTARFMLDRLPFLFGLGLVENACHETALLELIPAERLLEREEILLGRARELMGRLLFDRLDVLVIDEIGKNISGSGFDPNVSGRNNRFIPWSGPEINKIVLLDLTEESHGNACGMGLADIITAGLYGKVDLEATYTNAVTAAYLDSASIPVVMNSDREAIRLAVRTVVPGREPDACRLVRIKNTNELTNILVSKSLWGEVERHPDMELVRPDEPWRFDGSGHLVQPLFQASDPGSGAG